MSAQIVSVGTIYEGWSQLSRASVRLADGQTVERLIENHGNSVCVLPYDPERGVATFVRQFRAPVFATIAAIDLLEAPAGLTDGEPPETAAAREAIEETGLRLRTLQPAGRFWTMPGLSTERMDLFLARYSEKDRMASGGGHPEESENIAVLEIPLQDVAAMADDGRIEDMKTFALIQTLRLREPGLFREA
jgi:nudix-type nucleoside diphosphatase (YffH/AdpP family)